MASTRMYGDGCYEETAQGSHTYGGVVFNWCWL